VSDVHLDCLHLDNGDARPTLRVTLTDISERKRAERIAEQERLRLQTILRMASDGIHILDADGVLVEANEAFLNMLGYNDTAIGTLRVTDWDVQNSWPVIKELIDDLIARHGKLVFATRHRRSDGGILDVEINASWIEIGARAISTLPRATSPSENNSSICCKKGASSWKVRGWPRKKPTWRNRNSWQA